MTGDAGTGVFLCDPNCPTTPTTVFTTFFYAGLQIPGNAFSETTLLIIDKQPDNTRLKSAQGRSQFPPFYDFDALNASKQHVLNPGKLAHVEMCLYDDITYPSDIAVGHNPVFGAPGYPFEVLPDDGIILLTGCQPEGLTLVNPGGLQGMAVSAWQAAKRSMTAVFLPQTLQATTLAVGGTGSKGGSAGSLSPFGIVAPAVLDFTPNGNPTGQSFFEFSNLDWTYDCGGDSCTAYPTVKLIDALGDGIGDVPITVTLIPVNGAPGTFTPGGEGSMTTVNTDDSEDVGVARFDQLRITAAGTYKLRFSAPGKVAPLTSGEFTVNSD